MRDFLVKWTNLRNNDKRWRKKEEIKVELSKTVAKFVEDFEQMAIIICWFEHEDPAKWLLFERCLKRSLNLCCGHPRILFLRIAIALHILQVWRHNNYAALRRENDDEIWPRISLLTTIDARASAHYRKFYVWENLAESQWNIGETIRAFRDKLCAAVRSMIL